MMDETLGTLIARVRDENRADREAIELKSVTWERDDLLLKLVARQFSPSTDRPAEAWTLRCHEARDARLSAANLYGLRLADEHPLLLPHNSPTIELYFRGACDDAHRVVGQLVEAHHDVVGEWFEFRRFLNNASGPLSALLSGGFGRLATGPQPLIEKYAEVLRAGGLAVSSPSVQHWTKPAGPVRYVETGPMSVLFVGRSFVVGPKFTAERM